MGYEKGISLTSLVCGAQLFNSLEAFLAGKSSVMLQCLIYEFLCRLCDASVFKFVKLKSS